MDEFKLTLEGEGISVKRDIDRVTALAILNSILAGAPLPTPTHQAEPTPSLISASNPIPELASNQGPPVTSREELGEKPLTLREFVNQHEPKTNAQLILCIAHFMAEYEKIDRFSRDEIRPKFSLVGEPLPKNYSRDYQTVMDKGWVGEDPTKKGKFFVTRTGEAQFQNGFKGRRNK